MLSTSRLFNIGGLSLHVREWHASEEHTKEWRASEGREDSSMRTSMGLMSRPPIVLVHGLASNSRLWDGAASSLATLGYHVVAVDQRGHGLSDKPNDGYDMASVVEDLSSLIRTMQLVRPVVAGQSWGGNVVVELANRHPETVAGVCAVDGGIIQLADRFVDWESCASTLAPPAIAGMRASDFERMMRGAYAGWPETAIQGTLANMEVLDDGTIRPWLSRERHMKVLRGLWEHRPLEVVPRLSRPVLFTPADAGDARGIVRRRDYEAVVNNAAHVRVEWFKDAHHDLHAQFPQRWAETLHKYIESGFFA